MLRADSIDELVDASKLVIVENTFLKVVDMEDVEAKMPRANTAPVQGLSFMECIGDPCLDTGQCVETLCRLTTFDADDEECLQEVPNVDGFHLHTSSPEWVSDSWLINCTEYTHLLAPETPVVDIHTEEHASFEQSLIQDWSYSDMCCGPEAGPEVVSSGPVALSMSHIR